MPDNKNDDPNAGSTDGTGQSPEGAADNAADPAKVIEDLRKRQSGADKARDAAIEERNALKARLDSLLSGKSGGQGEDGKKDEATIRAEVQREYDEKLAKAQSAIEAATLDAKFPVARKRFPEVTDTAKLAELETVFGDVTPDPPKPIGNNPPKDAGGSKNIDDMSVAELRASLDKQAGDLFKG